MRNQAQILRTQLTHDPLDPSAQLFLNHLCVPFAQSQMSLFCTSVLPRARSNTCARTKGEDVPSILAGNASEPVKAICKVMTSDLRVELHTELMLLDEEMIKIRFITSEVIDHMSVCLDSLKSTMPSALVANEVVQLRNGDSVILEGRVGLLNEMDLWFSIVAEH